MNINGDHPQNLSRARQMFRGLMKGARQTARKMRWKKIREAQSKTPRQQCVVCSCVFDFSTSGFAPKVSVTQCHDCIQKLARGDTAAVVTEVSDGGKHRYAFFKVKDPELQKEWAGKVIPCSNAQFEELQKRYGGKEPTNPA